MASSSEAKPSAIDLVFATLAQSAGPLKQDELEKLTSLPTSEIAAAVNSLLKESRINVMSTDSNVLAFQVAEESQVMKQEKLKGLAKDEVLTYQLIQQAGDKGIWTKDMKTKSGVPHMRLPKILKNLESRNLIKAVKGVTGGNRKIYMLYELQPSEDLTGGTWYTENHLDEDFVESMRSVCLQYIQRNEDVTLETIASFIREKGFANVSLTNQDIKKIVTTLIYDGEVDAVSGPDEQEHYTPQTLRVPETTALSVMPCGHCPVIHECREGNDISPSNCVYMSEWLQF